MGPFGAATLGMDVVIFQVTDSAAADYFLE